MSSGSPQMCIRDRRTLKVGSASQKDMSQQDYELYGTYIPVSMAICHTINHKSVMDHTTYAHTGAMVNVYANGLGAEKFGGVFDNTEIFHKLARRDGLHWSYARCLQIPDDASDVYKRQLLL